jgi:hypothetical protein
VAVCAAKLRGNTPRGLGLLLQKLGTSLGPLGGQTRVSARLIILARIR